MIGQSDPPSRNGSSGTPASDWRALLDRLRACPAAWLSLGKRRAGSVAIVTAIAFPVMIGFVGLSIEVGMWLLVKRAMQGAADVASYSGVVALLSGSPN